jgi:hypothetical protein
MEERRLVLERALVSLTERAEAIAAGREAAATAAPPAGR